MAFELRKNLSLIATVAVIIIAGIGGYYLINLKQSEYPVSTFISVSYKWGVGDTLLNSYNSATSDYQYLNNRDSLIKTKVKLRANNIIFIHSRANELDLWNLPNVIANKNADLKSDKVLRYEMVFTYEHKTKKIIFLTDYDENPSIAIAADELQKVIKQTIDEVEDRYSKP
ncbi:hypothetical protein FA048_10330 [Pedobacter polaris]|uniref:Uncharacterized protein n=1 Tax=Pedobacter polaris TaxID=2571273 RepID=A0A4U1CWB7_9SPHI|nr:hypothetical protein [Pedobacter polaris]TKC10569.1 hypothetical protein FA048_10330 [Pedobacter polaris]